MERNEGFRVEAAHRVLVLVKLLSSAGSLSVREAAAALDVNPSTAQRLLATMVGDGFARQGERRRYFPGPEMARPAAATAPTLRDQVRPYLEQLFEEVNETVHLATLVGTEIHHVDGIEATEHVIRFGLRTGVRLSAHVTSSGKAMLASLSDDDIQARYQVASSGRRRRPLGADMDRLREALDKVRKQRVASNFEESEVGVAAFAISLGSQEGQHAALSIALPVMRCGRADVTRFGEALVAVADRYLANQGRAR
ncbi:IclR family transcriptional regulator [Streptomyces sp. NPDC020792]|uniref:IclR family transcriptional regulator n=1 Tax=Streptomyces sp. NPDC020792 TaxID=3365089 RepID=UPI00378FF424